VTIWVLCYFRHGIKQYSSSAKNHQNPAGARLDSALSSQKKAKANSKKHLRDRVSSRVTPSAGRDVKCIAHRLNSIQTYSGKQWTRHECLHESGSGLSSYIRAPGSACIMRCSNAFTQLSMLLKKIQHT
jgi:hypothetical protein